MKRQSIVWIFFLVVSALGQEDKEPTATAQTPAEAKPSLRGTTWRVPTDFKNEDDDGVAGYGDGMLFQGGADGFDDVGFSDDDTTDEDYDGAVLDYFDVEHTAVAE